jgi:hypothetical protein
MTRIAVFEQEANGERQSLADKASPPLPASSASRAVSRRPLRCDHCVSEHIAVCSIELRFLCMNHFVAYCYQRLEEYEATSKGGENPDTARGFLRECAAQATKLSLIGQELQNIDRARLLDIVLWSNYLFGRPVLKFKEAKLLSRYMCISARCKTSGFDAAD